MVKMSLEMGLEVRCTCLNLNKTLESFYIEEAVTQILYLEEPFRFIFTAVTEKRWSFILKVTILTYETKFYRHIRTLVNFRNKSRRQKARYRLPVLPSLSTICENSASTLTRQSMCIISCNLNVNTNKKV